MGKYTVDSLPGGQRGLVLNKERVETGEYSLNYFPNWQYSAYLCR